MTHYQPDPEQNEFQEEGFNNTNEALDEEAYNEAMEQYQDKLQEYQYLEEEARREFSYTKISDYIIKEWNKAKAKLARKNNQKVAKSNNMIKTAEKKIPSAHELAAYIEALSLYLKHGKIKDKVIVKLIKNLPYPDKVRMHFSEEECKLLFESIAFAWKKITKQDLVEETKIEHPPKGLEGNYWMLTGGVILEGPNHFTIVKQNLNLFATLLNISSFVLHEKMASPPDELIKTILDHGAMRIYIDQNKHGYFQLSDETYSKWGRKKIKGLDLKKKTTKVIDRSRPYKGWDTGINIKL
jgi:hypothetical protein